MSTASTPQERRRILLVDGKNQLKYVGIIIAAILGINFLIGLCLYFSVWTSLSNEYSRIAIAQKIQLADRIRSYQEARIGQPEAAAAKLDEQAELLSDHLLGQLNESFHRAQIKLLPILLLLLLVVIFEGIAISNRIAGPIYHAEKSLAKLSQGDLTDRTRFRKRDEFQGLSDKLNVVSEQWNFSISTLKRLLGRISGSAAELKQSLGRYNPESEMQVSAQADMILKKVAECNNVLARFHVTLENQPEPPNEQHRPTP